MRQIHLLLLVALLLTSFPASAAPAAPPAKPWPTVQSAKADQTTVPMYQRITIDVTLQPADPEALAVLGGEVFASVTPPSGQTYTVPGFLYQPFTRTLEAGVEKDTPAGPLRWQIRLALREPGLHHVTVGVTVPEDQPAKTVPYDKPLEITAVKVDAPGYVRRSPANSHYFVTDRGESYFPVGVNRCWTYQAGTFDYDRVWPEYAKVGCNYARIFLSSLWAPTFRLNTLATGYNRVDPAAAWRLDQVMEQSERLGIRLLLCIDGFNILSNSKEFYGSWPVEPYCQANGGPCVKPADYFTNPEMLRAYRARLRYLVARWGYSTSVFAWEFWNEVDGIKDYHSDLVTAWHRDMARYLRSTDPWQHLRTTSTGRPEGDPQLDALPELDFVQTHHYLNGDIVAGLDADRAHKAAAANHPHYVGEFGFVEGNSEVKVDPSGHHLHDALYASVGQENAGTPMAWWWASYVEALNLYPIYGSFTRWIAGFDFAAQNAHRLPSDIVYAKPAAAGSADPPLRAYLLGGQTRALAWIQNPRYRYDRPAAKNPILPVEDATLRLGPLPAGAWTVEFWDTQKGAVASTRKITTDADGRLAVPLPPITWDLALRLHLN